MASPRSPKWPTGANPYAVAAVDLNGDGKPDLAVVNASSNSVGVLLNNGSGAFAPAGSYVIGVDPDGIAVADLNSDGRQDLVVANPGSNDVSVLLNVCLP